MRNLSKSKIIAFRQCPKRLWLEIHHPELAVYSAAAQKAFSIGHQVGDIARQLYDPNGTGTLLNAQTEGYDVVFARTRGLLDAAYPTPVFKPVSAPEARWPSPTCCSRPPIPTNPGA